MPRAVLSDVLTSCLFLKDEPYQHDATTGIRCNMSKSLYPLEELPNIGERRWSIDQWPGRIQGRVSG